MSFFSFFKPVAHLATPVLQTSLAIAENQGKQIVTNLAAQAAAGGVQLLTDYLHQKLQSGETALTVQGQLTPADQDLLKLKMAFDEAKAQLPTVRDSVIYGAITAAVLELKGTTPATIEAAPSDAELAARRAPMVDRSQPYGGVFAPGAKLPSFASPAPTPQPQQQPATPAAAPAETEK